MKLRNKKTGEADEFLFEVISDRIDLYRRVATSETEGIWHYNSLAEFNEEWEDYKPTEPLIKDEDAREAVFSWASSLQIHEVKCTKRADSFCKEVTTFEAFRLGSAAIIEFPSYIDADVANGKIYTIVELCGEGEE